MRHREDLADSSADGDQSAGPEGAGRVGRRGGGRRIAVALTVLAPVVAGVVAVALRAASAPADAPGRTSARPAASVLREPTEKEKELLHKAGQLLLRDCMRRKGFEYRTFERNPVADAREFPYVIDDVDWARRHGYGSDIERAMQEIRRNDVNQHYFQGLPAERRAAALAAANGARPQGLTARTPDGMTMTRSSAGCQSEAEGTLYQDLRAWFQAQTTATALPPMRNEKVAAEPEFAKATRSWATCMRAAGHDYADPAALRAALPPPERPLPRGQEVELAVDEADCARTSGLGETARRLDRKHDAELRRRYRTEVEARLRLQLAALPRARSVIEKAGQR
ncbi:hypothetical protein AB0H73_38145 [Streptomyces olivoreticuli]